MMLVFMACLLVSAQSVAGGAMNNRLRVLRAERGWSQADLADRLDVSRQTINAIEVGKYDPSLPLAFKMARLFSLRIEEIFQDGVNANQEAAE
jgi:putative transcriptional regulator